MTYLTDDQINRMAEAGADAFKMTGDDSAVMRAAEEYAVDEFSITPRRSAIRLAYNRAALIWEARKMAAKRAIKAEG